MREAYWEQGYTMQAIADYAGLHPSTVNRLIKVGDKNDCDWIIPPRSGFVQQDPFFLSRIMNKERGDLMAAPSIQASVKSLYRKPAHHAG